jgi:alpha-N-acetylgalactosaminidase
MIGTFGVSLVFVSGLNLVDSLNNGVARTPPMGWLSWMKYACNTDCKTYPDDCINAQLYMDMADVLSTDGWREVGYEYVNIDDCWASVQRDGSNNVVADPVRFPNGIKGVCDYVHSKGLKCGLYTDIGTMTCGGYPGLNTAGNMTQTQQDIAHFISWGIDSLKVDGCYAETNTMPQTYPAVSKLLTAQPRQVLYSCSWPAYISDNMTPAVYQALQQYCNIWRNYDDINDQWSSLTHIIAFWKANPDMAGYAGPGSFNDPDMIIVGNNGLSLTQQQVQLAMWSIFTGPLLMSNDLRTISTEARNLLQNRDLIAINQDPSGIQGLCVSGCGSNSEQSVWVKPLSFAHTFAVALLNEHTGVPGYPVYMTVNAADIDASRPNATLSVKDVFTGKHLGTFYGKYKNRIGSSSVQLLTVILIN